MCYKYPLPGRKGSFQGLPLASTLWGYIFRNLKLKVFNDKNIIGIILWLARSGLPIPY